MLSQLWVRQVRQWVQSSGLPVAIELWTGERVSPTCTPRVHVRLHKPAGLKTLARPSLGALARAYVEGELDLEGDIRDILSMGDSLCNGAGHHPGKRSRWMRRPGDASKNIQYHYDVSNAFYALWLGPVNTTGDLR